MTLSMKPAVTSVVQRTVEDSAEIVVIGIGNILRRDDGAGLVLADRLTAQLAAHGLFARLMCTHQLLPEMAAEIADPDVRGVIFVDVSTGFHCGSFEIRSVDVDSPSASSGHHLSPATLLLYAALLYGHSPLGWMVTIPGHDFSHGEGYSRLVRQYLTNEPRIAAAMLQILEDANLCTN